VIAVIVGSGMSHVVDRFETRSLTYFQDIDGVGAATVEGHRGEVRTCLAEGVEFILVSGRRHVYEGAAGAASRLCSWLADLGAAELVTISAAGAVGPTLCVGDLVVVDDIIDMQNRRRDPSGSAIRPAAISPGLKRRLERACAAAGIRASRATMVSCAGPAYETPAEVRAIGLMRADVAAMSGAPEIEFGHRAGLDVAALAAVTNRATGVGASRPRHSEVLGAAAGLSRDVAAVIWQLVVIK
jgi:purine nucleoside phosphorylase